jgi:hypothetical protein
MNEAIASEVRPQAARCRSAARTRTPRPPIWPNEAKRELAERTQWEGRTEGTADWQNEANAEPFASSGILAERTQWAAVTT